MRRTGLRVLAAGLVALAGLTACSSGSSGGSGADGGDPAAQPDLATTAPKAAPGKVPEGFAPLSVSFVSPTTGWVMGAPDCASPQCTTVVHTTDGGLTWSTVTPPPADTEDLGKAGVTDLRFASPRDGFAFGGGLFATHDGSRTWQAMAVPGEVQDLAVAGGRVYAVVVQGCTADGCAGPGSLFTGSVSGGSLRPVPGVTLLGQGLDHVVLRGRSVLVVSGSEGTVPYLLTSPDGARFLRRPLPCGRGAAPAADAADANQLLVVCDTDTDSGTTRTAYTSSDAGASWAAAGAPPQAAGTVVALTGRAAFVTDTQNGVSVSTDGGRTWRPSYNAGEEGATYVGFVDDSFGVALAGAGGQADGPRLVLTRDGGSHWVTAF